MSVSRSMRNPRRSHKTGNMFGSGIHTPVDPHIVPPHVGITGDHGGKGVNKSPPVPQVPFGHRNLLDVDVLPLEDILLERRCGNFFRRDTLFVSFLHGQDQISGPGSLGETKSQGKAPVGRDRVGEELFTKRVGVTLDVVEKKRHPVFSRHAVTGNGPNLTVPIHLNIDFPVFAFVLEQVDPVTDEGPSILKSFGSQDMVPSITISAEAGTNRSLVSHRTSSSGSPTIPP